MITDYRDTGRPVFITAVIKAKNEEDNIADCIHSLRGFADEILVIDDASIDRTANIAEAEGARVVPGIEHGGLIDLLDKQGFELAHGRWIIRLDADERMRNTLAEALRREVERDEVAGVRFARENFLFGSSVLHGGWFKADQLRFFKRDSWDRDWSAVPHSQPTLTGAIRTLPTKREFTTLHFDYDTVQEFIERTLLRYASTEAVVRFKAGYRFSIFRLIVRPLTVFFGRFLLRRGFLDGSRGVILAGLLACYWFLIEAMIWDIQRKLKESRK